jgi:hypothetical protein
MKRTLAFYAVPTFAAIGIYLAIQSKVSSDTQIVLSVMMFIGLVVTANQRSNQTT